MYLYDHICKCWFFSCRFVFYTIKGSPQFIEIEFSSPVTVTEVAIQFQGGFTSRDCTLLADGDAQLMKFYPDDSSSLQVRYNCNNIIIIPY